MKDKVLDLLEEELAMKQYTIRELERMGYETVKELGKLDDAGDKVEYYEEIRQRLLDEMTCYRKAIIRNKRIIERLNIGIDNLKNNDR